MAGQYDTEEIEDQVLALIRKHPDPESAAAGVMGAIAALTVNELGVKEGVEALYAIADMAVAQEAKRR